MESPRGIWYEQVGSGAILDGPFGARSTWRAATTAAATGAAGDDSGGTSWGDGGSSGGDSYTEMSTEGWGSRVGKAFLSIPIGLVLFGISFVVLFWNEKRAVETAKGLAEGKSSVVSIQSDKVDPAYEGKLVHLSGEASTDETLKDPQFGLTAPKTIRLRRIVQMYQWKESSETTTRKKLGGGEERTTTYHYGKTWSDQPINSSSFKKPDGHQNPGNWPFNRQSIQSQSVNVGAFKLPDSLVQQIDDPQPLAIDQTTLDSLPDDIKSTVKLDAGRLYRGDDPSQPKVGDMTIAFEVVKPQAVSLLAKQVGGTFEAYPTQVGTTIERLQAGTATAAEMFKAAEAENSALTWILRLVGFILMAVGIAMVLSPLSVLADVVPFIGSIVGFGTGFIAFGLASVLSLVTIAIGWMAYRPIVGISVLVGAVAILFLFSKLARTADHPGRQDRLEREVKIDFFSLRKTKRPPVPSRDRWPWRERLDRFAFEWHTCRAGFILPKTHDRQDLSCQRRMIGRIYPAKDA